MTAARYATQRLSVIASTYDDVNNHVLHTLLVRLATELGGWSRVVLRMPAFLSFCLLLPVLWQFVRREYGRTAAMFATALVATSPIFPGYATNARGYTLLLLFFVVVLLCGQALVRSPARGARRGLWPTWALAIALGLYAVPLMVVPAATAAVWMLLARWRSHDGRDLGSFALKIAAWSAVALAGAGALYLPALATEGMRGVAETLAEPKLTMRSPALATLPLDLWRDLHLMIPAWARGALLLLVGIGAAARGRSCARRGTLWLAISAVVGAYALLRFPLPLRYATWVLLVCMILAGAGAALVLDRATARAPAVSCGIVALRHRRVLECVGLGVVVVSFLWWTSRSDAVTKAHANRSIIDPAMVSSVAGEMRPDDYFGGCGEVEYRTIAYVLETHTVDHGVGSAALGELWFRRVSAVRSTAWHEADALSLAGPRLFLFDVSAGLSPPPPPWGDCRGPGDLATRGELILGERDNRELVAAFGTGSRVWLFNGLPEAP